MSADNGLKTLLTEVLPKVGDPTKGLPDPVFEFALRIVPMINVDLLVRNAAGEHLLAWREDEYYTGWHVPGGIIRFNEPIAERIAAVADMEIKSKVTHDPLPVDINEFFTPRGHFISLLYLCRLPGSAVSPPAVAPEVEHPRQGALAWHRGVPPRLYKVHGAYTDWLNGRTK